jgi:arylsulfatase A-like enzyme
LAAYDNVAKPEFGSDRQLLPNEEGFPLDTRPSTLVPCAALITGRNHHSVGFAVIGELSTGHPGYDSVIGPESATIGEILKQNGYSASWFGKNHNTPSFQLTTAEPYDQ